MDGLARYVSAFAGESLAVLGDLVADEYIHGTTSRISREAPVLIVGEEAREIRPGGAANVVANIRAMGGAPRPVGLVGDDAAGGALLEKLHALGVICDGVMVDQQRFTTCKTRVLAGGRNTVRQQMLRIDRLNPGPVEPEIGRDLLERLRHALDGAAGLVVSDYGEGVVEGDLFEAVLATARAGEVPVFVDSRSRIEQFPGVDTLTPNVPEISAASGIDLLDEDGIENAGRWLLQATGVRAVLVKRGRNGMALFQPDQRTEFVAAHGSDEVADVTGAGDTVLAAWSLARAAGAVPVEAMVIANTAGGIKVTKAGTAVVEAEELSRALKSHT